MAAAELFSSQEAEAFEDRGRPLAVSRLFEQPIPTLRRETKMEALDSFLRYAAIRQVRAAEFGFGRFEQAAVELIFGPCHYAKEPALFVGGVGPGRGTARLAGIARGWTKVDAGAL